MKVLSSTQLLTLLSESSRISEVEVNGDINIEDLLDAVAIQDPGTSINISSCIFNDSFGSGNLIIPYGFILTSCQFKNHVSFHGFTWQKRLEIRNCHFEERVYFECSTFEDSVSITDNIFSEFTGFEDSDFKGTSFEFKKNSLIKGSDLLGNENRNFRARFSTGILIEDNSGLLNLDGSEINS